MDVARHNSDGAQKAHADAMAGRVARLAGPKHARVHVSHVPGVWQRWCGLCGGARWRVHAASGNTGEDMVIAAKRWHHSKT